MIVQSQPHKQVGCPLIGIPRENTLMRTGVTLPTRAGPPSFPNPRTRGTCQSHRRLRKGDWTATIAELHQLSCPSELRSRFRRKTSISPFLDSPCNDSFGSLPRKTQKRPPGSEQRAANEVCDKCWVSAAVSRKAKVGREKTLGERERNFLRMTVLLHRPSVFDVWSFSGQATDLRHSK